MNRLSPTIHPYLQPNVLETLFKRKIFTVLQFVQNDPEKIARITGLNYKDVLHIRRGLLQKMSSPVVDGLACLNEMMTCGVLLPSGIVGLDNLLEGGFYTSNIYEICGPSPCGKTQMCMTLAANIIKNYPHTITYIDTKNDLNANRLFEIADCNSNSEIMKKMNVCSVRSGQELLQVLHCFSKETRDCRVLLIDSLTIILYKYLGENSTQGITLLNNIGNILRYISSKYIAVIVTNLVTRWTSDEDEVIQKPALGKYWQHFPNTRITMQKLPNSHQCLLTVSKSCFLPIGKSTKVSISDKGVT